MLIDHDVSVQEELFGGKYLQAVYWDEKLNS